MDMLTWTAGFMEKMDIPSAFADKKEPAPKGRPEDC